MILIVAKTRERERYGCELSQQCDLCSSIIVLCGPSSCCVSENVFILRVCSVCEKCVCVFIYLRGKEVLDGIGFERIMLFFVVGLGRWLERGFLGDLGN